MDAERKTSRVTCACCNGTGEAVIANQQLEGFPDIEIIVECNVCDGEGYVEQKILIRKRRTVINEADKAVA